MECSKHLGLSRYDRAWPWAGLVAGAWLLGGCTWVGLGWHALTYPTTQDGEAGNVVASDDHAYVTSGAAGIEIIALSAGVRRQMPLPAGLDSVDDLALADGLLFALDARPPGRLAVFSLRDPLAPALAGAPAPVEVGPFSGIAAAGGRVVVSGGTSRLSLRTYDTAGNLGPLLAQTDLGRGQPDVALDATARRAYVSTHDWGPYFSLVRLDLNHAGPRLVRTGKLSLESYGFTAGGARPANFPVESAVNGATVYVATATGLSIIDATAGTLRLHAHLDLPVRAVNVDVRAGVAALVGSSPQPTLVLVDVRDNTRPQILQSFPLPRGSLATGVALTTGHIVVAARGQGVLLFDRSKGDRELVAVP
jgi:hypothetical protein